MAVIGGALGGAGERAERWRERLESLALDPAVNLLDWRETRRDPTLALRVRFALLRRRFDVVRSAELTDWPALAPRVSAGDERICFWGSAETIAVMRSWLRSAQTPDPDALAGLRLGTITYVRERRGAAEIMIADHLASEASTVPSLAVGILTCRALFAEGVAAIRTEIRNRRPGGRAPSGVAGHILSVRELGTSYWGVVPWYIGWGAQEVLDYCDLPACPETARRLIERTPELPLARDEDRELVAALVALNLGDERLLPRIRAASRRAQPPMSWDLHVPSPLLMPWQRVVVSPAESGRYASLGAALAAAAEMPRATCVTVELPLERPPLLAAQRELADAGFVLSALAPPVAGERGRVGFVGLWSRVSSGLPIATPYYSTSKLMNAREREVVGHVERISQSWNGVAQPARAA